ncbi:hypothetical protein [Halobaculum litoreum]|uniref:Uncharacterized protein n=1 Tax=Halobaculum litoreum TaxID=3031998 RepID=A0ABD5XU01_9EURY|nr:hypothetical protein [Halobaculum sp. DT92]
MTDHIALAACPAHGSDGYAMSSVTALAAVAARSAPAFAAVGDANRTGAGVDGAEGTSAPTLVPSASIAA